MKWGFDQLWRAVWTIGQPLTRVPSEPGVPVSDLFIWRRASEWQTSFELIDIPGLFAGEKVRDGHPVTIHCFDQGGKCILQERLASVMNRRKSIDMSAFVGSGHGEVGTFAVFHTAPPQVVTALGSYLAERGYVSYRFREAPLRAYVHGNLDAISLKRDTTVEPLGARGLFTREYRLQHEMRGRVRYELGLVNPTGGEQRCTIEFLSAQHDTVMEIRHVVVGSKGVALIPYEVNEGRSARVVIKSPLIMARPLVFRIQDQSLDVFHG